MLDQPDTNFWTKSAYTIPDTPHANMAPGEAGVKMVPINRMVPRSFLTNLADGAVVRSGEHLELRGISFGGDCGVTSVDVTTDGGKSWRAAQLGKDDGQYGSAAGKVNIHQDGHLYGRRPIRHVCRSCDRRLQAV